MDELFKKFEKYTSYILMVIAMLFVCTQVFTLIVEFGGKLLYSFNHHTFMTEEKGKPVAGVFFTILLTFEIIQTIKMFAHDHDVKVKIILIVGLIAVTRKILMYDMENVNPNSEFAIAALILALSTGYYLVSRSVKPDADK